MPGDFLEALAYVVLGLILLGVIAYSGLALIRLLKDKGWF